MNGSFDVLVHRIDQGASGNTVRRRGNMHSIHDFTGVIFLSRSMGQDQFHYHADSV